MSLLKALGLRGVIAGGSATAGVLGLPQPDSFGNLRPLDEVFPIVPQVTPYGEYFVRDADQQVAGIVIGINRLVEELDAAKSVVATVTNEDVLFRLDDLKRRFKGEGTPAAQAAKLVEEMRRAPATDVLQYADMIRIHVVNLKGQLANLADGTRRLVSARKRLRLDIDAQASALLGLKGKQLREAGEELQKELHLAVDLMKDAVDFIVNLGELGPLAVAKLAVDALGSLLGFFDDNDLLQQAKDVEKAAEDLHLTELAGRVALAHHDISDVAKFVKDMSAVYDQARQTMDSIRRHAIETFDQGTKGAFHFSDLEAAEQVVQTIIGDLRGAGRSVAAVRMSYVTWRPPLVQRFGAQRLSDELDAQISTLEKVVSKVEVRATLVQAKLGVLRNAAEKALLTAGA